MAGVSAEVIGVALASFRKLGWLWFMKCLLRNSIRFMRSNYGVNWSSKPCRSEEGITELGCDQAAIMSLLWHSSQTDWFEYNAGSKLVHFRFPLCYQKAARNGLPVYFERPGPTTKGLQPLIADPGLRERAREKIAKVLHRRYLVPQTASVNRTSNILQCPRVKMISGWYMMLLLTV